MTVRLCMQFLRRMVFLVYAAWMHKRIIRGSSTFAAWARLTLIAAGAAVAPSLLGGCETTTSDKDIVIVKADEAFRLWETNKKSPETVLFIDPRPVAQYQEGHIPGAVRMEFDPDMVRLGRDPRIEQFDNIIVYGFDPGSPLGRGMTKRLMELEYDEVRFFAGGLNEWKSNQHPVETGDSPELPSVRGRRAR